MNDVPEYLTNFLDDPEASPSRKEMARRILDHRGPPTHYRRPVPATYSEIVADVMLVEGKLKAAELGLAFADHARGVVGWLWETLTFKEPWLAHPVPVEATIAEAMLAAGRATAQRFPAEYVSLDRALCHIREFLRLDEYAI
jgi:hypothetical protein